MVRAFCGMATVPEYLLTPDPPKLLATTVPPLGWIVEPAPTVIVVPGGSVPLVTWLAGTVVAEGIVEVHCGKPPGPTERMLPTGPPGSWVATLDALPYQIAPGASGGSGLLVHVPLPTLSNTIILNVGSVGGAAGKCSR